MADLEITQILREWERDPRGAVDRLTPLLYSELRKMAAACLRGARPDQTLQPTALVNELYLRLARQPNASFANRGHFFGAAATVMRQVMADSLRKHYAQKRGGGQKVQLDEELSVASNQAGAFLELNQAIDKLHAWDERKCRVVELRHFAGLEQADIAETLGISLATVKRDLAVAEAFLRRELAS
jgi:RNA polymerase sigma factor (TIGR02999 family)